MTPAGAAALTGVILLVCAFIAGVAASANTVTVRAEERAKRASWLLLAAGAASLIASVWLAALL